MLKLLVFISKFGKIVSLSQVEKLFEKYNSLLLLDALHRMVLLNKAVKTAYKTKDSLTRVPVARYQNAAE